MQYLSTLYIWGLCIFLARGFRRTHLVAILAVGLWYGVEYTCLFAPPFTSFLLVAGSFYFCLALPGEPIHEKGKVRFLLRTINIIFCGCTALVCFYCGLLASYAMHFGTFGQEQFFGILQTNLREAWEASRTYVGERGLVAVFICELVVFMPFFLPRRWFTFSLKPYCRWACLLIAIAPLWCALTYIFTTSFTKISHCLYKAYVDNEKFTEMLRSRPDFSAVRRQEAKDITIILVIGESATTAHMSAYGYYRPTTPWLRQASEKGEALIFTRAMSSHSITMYTVPLMLSLRKQQTQAEVRTSPSVINAFSAKGYNTWWISNQEPIGQYASIISVLGKESDYSFFSGNNDINAKIYDSRLLPQIREALQSDAKGKLIMVHLMGSHYDYAARYPADFKPDLGPVLPGLWGAHNAQKLKEIDTYDTSIAYTDAFLRDLTQMLPQEQNIVLVYASDHGESTLGKYFHDSTYQLHHDVFSIPLMLWTTQAFRSNHPTLLQQLADIRDRYFTNDQIADLLLLLEAGEGDPTLLTMPDAASTPIRHAQYVAADITYAKTAACVRQLRQQTGKRFLLQHANSLEKLQIARRCDFDGVEIDVTPAPDTGTLMVGHGAAMSGLPLEAYLRVLQDWEGVRVWLSLHEEIASGWGEADIIKQLDMLDQIYHFKSRTVIAGAADYQRAGWKSAFSVPDSTAADAAHAVCTAVELARERTSPAALVINADTYAKAQPQCPRAFADITLNGRVEPTQYGKKLLQNAIADDLPTSPLMFVPQAEYMLLPMTTEADL